MKRLKKLEGKTIQSAHFWPNDEGRVTLELHFDNEEFFCLVMDRPIINADLYFDNAKRYNEMRPLKKYKV